MQDLINRAENYRNELNKQLLTFENFDNTFGDLNNIDVDIKSKDNIFVNCKLKLNEAQNGCVKKLKIKRLINCNKVVKEQINVRFPAGIKNMQSIVLKQRGNYIKNKQKYSDLIITVNIK